MKTQYTPGPWKAEAPCGYNPSRAMVSACNRQVDIYNAPLTPETKANARLIAASPMLFEACKYAAQWYSDNINIMPVAFQTVVNELEAAISAAEGTN